MRIIVSRLWGGAQSGLPGKADSGYMVGTQDFDLTDSDLASEVKQINSKLENAIAHDIETTNGNAVAQELDAASGSTDFTDVCRLLFLSSLANSLDQLHGLNRSEIIGYLAAPNRDVAKLSQDVIDRLQASAWYLHTARDGRLFFKDVQNINAKLESVTRTMLRDSKEKELREQLDKIFAPTAKDCYQRHLSLPALDEIALTQDAVTLVLVRPSEGSIQTLRQFYDQQTFKNRICFLTGDPSQYDRVLDAASRLTAITSILKELRADGLRDDNPQVQEALDILTKLQGKLYIAVKSTFLTLYYPIKDGLHKLDMDFQYPDHAFIAEEQVKNALVAAYKYTKDIGVETAFPRSVENKLWPSGKQETPWSQVKSNAAQLGSWVWHVPNALDSLKSIMIARGQWRESEGYVDKGPFPQPSTEVRIQNIRRDDDTGKVTLRVTPIHGDRVYMETGGAEATTASRLIDEGVVETDEMECSFLAVDSTKVHETGDAVKWFNQVKIKHRFFQEGDKMRCELKAAPSSAIKFTTDGSNPASSGGTYDAPFVVPLGARFVQAIPANGKGQLQKFDVPKEPEKVVIDLTKPYEWKRTFKRDSNMDTFSFLGQCRKHDVWLSGVRVYIGHERRWVELTLDNDTYHEVEAIEKVIEALRTLLENGSISLEATSLNLETGQALQDLVADLHMTLKPGEIIQVEPRP